MAPEVNSKVGRRTITVGELMRDLGDLREVQKQFPRRHSIAHIPNAGVPCNTGFGLHDLVPLPSTRRKSILAAPSREELKDLFKRARIRTDLAPVQESSTSTTEGYKMLAVLAVLLNVGSVIPFVKIIAHDPGSPLFISFATHIFVVVVNLPRVPTMLQNQKLPMVYHVLLVCLAFTFNFLKSDAFSRLPTAAGMVLMNLQMLIGMGIQSIAFKQQFSVPQISACGVVTVGVMLAGISVKSPSSASAGQQGTYADFLFGTSELIAAIIALVLLSITTKMAFTKHGEAVDEQIVFQHLFSLPLFCFGSQWSKIGPRLWQLIYGTEFWMMALLLANLSLTVAGSKARVTFVSRAPNGLLVQLVETLTKFISLFATALINAPPLPSLGFFGGSGVLMLGTLQFLTASDAPERGGGKKD